MLNEFIDLLGLLMFSMLNPITWFLVIFLALKRKSLWQVMASGTPTQLFCSLLLIYFLKSSMETSLDTKWIGSLVLVGFGIVGGIIISALTWVLFRRYRLAPSDA